MKHCLITIACHLALLQFGQVEVKGPWHLEIGTTTNTFFRDTSSLNIRYISPRFGWREDLSEEEEKNPEPFKNTRLMVELIYRPVKKVIATGFNVQSRILRTKRFSTDVYCGVKFFIKPGKDFVRIPYLKGGREIWYMSIGIIGQLDLGVVLPFFDLGGDGIITLGTEINLNKVYRKPKRRYNLNTKPSK